MLVFLERKNRLRLRNISIFCCFVRFKEQHQCYHFPWAISKIYEIMNDLTDCCVEMPHKSLQCCWQFISTWQPLANIYFLEFKKDLHIFTRSQTKNSPSLHQNILQYDKWTWVWRGKERRAFSVTLVFEVKILWTGPENIFPRSLLKVHILPSQKWSFDQKDSHSLCGYRVWCWNCGFVLTTRWDSLQAPVSWTTTHTSNIQSDTNPWGKPCKCVRG